MARNYPNFSKENQPDHSKRIKRGGRKPSLLKQFTGEYEIEIPELANLIKRVLFAYTLPELTAIVQDEKYPMAVRHIVRAYLEDFKKGNLLNWNVLINRIWGMPAQPLDHSGSIATGVTAQTPEERRAEIEELLLKRDAERKPNEETT